MSTTEKGQIVTANRLRDGHCRIPQPLGPME